MPLRKSLLAAFQYWSRIQKTLSIQGRPLLIPRFLLALNQLVESAGRLGWWIDPVRTVAASVALAYPKFKLDAEQQGELLADYLPWCETVRISSPPPLTPGCRDVYDQPFLQLAVAAQADYLVSGDADLLSLSGQIACPIVTAETFLKTFD